MFTVSGIEFFMHYMLWFLGLFLRYRYSVYIFLVIKVCGLFLGAREITIDLDTELRITLDTLNRSRLCPLKRSRTLPLDPCTVWQSQRMGSCMGGAGMNRDS